MREEDKKEFANVMRAAFDIYGRQLPLPETLRVWFDTFAAVDIESFRRLMTAHITENPTQFPTPGLLIEKIKKADGRPGVEEAWAIAIKGFDESETVVLTDEISTAMGVARPIFELGDEVGARMAFKEVYARLVKEAQSPVKWWPSVGHDPYKRDTALSEAKKLGLLPAPQIIALLPPPMPSKSNSSPEGLARLKAEMEKMTIKNAADKEEARLRREAERKAEIELKARIDERVRGYGK